MKNTVTIILMVILLCLMTGCLKNGYTCDCRAEYPQMYTPYTQDNFTLSWTDFNDLHSVQEYFGYHDSTILEHKGDTIKLYGYIGKNNIYPVGNNAFQLHPKPQIAYPEPQQFGDFNCRMTCFFPVYVYCKEERRVEEWMTEPDRMVYVEGTVVQSDRRFDHDSFTGEQWEYHEFGINAVRFDSVPF